MCVKATVTSRIRRVLGCVLKRPLSRVSGVFRDRQELEELGARSEAVETLREAEHEASNLSLC